VRGGDETEELRSAAPRVDQRTSGKELRLELVHPDRGAAPQLAVPELVRKHPGGCCQPEAADRREFDATTTGRNKRHDGPGQCRHEREELEADLGECPEQPRRMFVLEPQQLVLVRHRCLLTHTHLGAAGASGQRPAE
jgi:hypothetical protein